LLCPSSAIAQAREILGTTGITDTIGAALRDTIRRAAAERLIERMTTMNDLDLAVPR
jgi:Arc/MetJ family transcription regulator